ncbi:Alpha/Beta hydrolase protein [Talaromyces proteolyticus]|uniref:Alpha/Beta hydrolase protein n=1 Tax=Talaromyces proteolyticus TaxID=1131652 RepID=A0AAD4PXH8_9EURO|nr:Alpha/Beta hydrolase protein [Talaromyces proteolyticus]KAH8700115.1 Alpha/Beta hydrolase protein [Talaromyces proteolyticus]
MSQKPSIVIIPGSFTGPDIYSNFASLLRGRGYEVIVGILQSANRTRPEKAATLQEDAAYFRGVAETLASQGKDVVVVGHSYGGVVATESVKGVIKTEREAHGKAGGVVRVVYLVSVVADIGQGNFEAFGGQLGPFIRILQSWVDIPFPKGEFMHIDPEAGAPSLYSDLPENEALEWARLSKIQSTASFLDPVTFAAVDYVPVTYIHTSTDRIIPLENQKGFVAKLKSRNAKNVSTITINADHYPIVTAPEETAKGIIDAIEGN